MIDWLKVPWVEKRPLNRNYSSRAAGMRIDSIVLHYTAAAHYMSSVAWFQHPECTSSSAHFVVGRRGQVVQLVPLNMRAWHAGDGRIEHDGALTDPNQCSIGIEIANHGLLEETTDGYATDWGLNYDLNKYAAPRYASLKYDSGLVVSGPWEPYPHYQVGGVLVLCQELVEQFDIPLNRIVGHQDTALPAGHKKDPGPLWPWESFLSRLEGRDLQGKDYRRTKP